jgi:hypothetical protein
MNAIDALNAARSVGVKLAVDGGNLVLDAASPPPQAVLDALSRHQADIVVLLRPGRDGWSAEDWRVFFDERRGTYRCLTPMASSEICRKMAIAPDASCPPARREATCGFGLAICPTQFATACRKGWRRVTSRMTT